MNRPARRRLAALALLGAVALLHLALLQTLGDRLGAGRADTLPVRLQAAFVRVLQPAAPVAVAPPPRPRPRPRPPAPAPEPPERVASAPEPPASSPELAAVLPEPVAAASEPTAAASEPVAVAQAASAPPAFEWPPSTRMSYVLTGNYRGPVDGSAQVLWLRDGDRYQVHLDVVIGPEIAPLILRQMSSDGTLGADGLAPRRYDERTRILFREPRGLTMHFGGGEVQLANGRRVPQPAGVQDTVSQFVQLTWRFTLQPDLLTEGRVIEVPLALPRRVETWTYDVRARETLYTPAGEVEAVRVQPRRAPRAGGDLVAEMWFAPSLQYLPARIVIRQDAETYVDLLVRRLPEQAAPPADQPASTPKR